jgi:carbamate kinase
MTEPSSLIVAAVGGNAISPPAGPISFADERAAIERAVDELAALAADRRLLIVHGNGPQVGKLLAAEGVGDPDALDIHVAQTQGELGYLLAHALERRLGRPGSTVALVTRVRVDARDPSFAHPSKPVGRILAEPPPDVASARTPDHSGWRRVVASPRPLAVVEESAVAALLKDHHVVAGGGGGVALDGVTPCAAVIDKDWTAALLAVRLGAGSLLFVTDVSHAFDAFGSGEAQPIRVMRVDEARARLSRGVFAPGSMAPKVESAIQFVSATGRTARIATIGEIDAALSNRAGTRIVQ